MTLQQPVPEKPSLPPRPNLGPEPYPEPDRPSAWWFCLGIPIVALAAWKWRRIRVKMSANPSSAGPHEENPVERSPSERLIQLADRLRAKLVTRFGPGWAALTTEELEVALPSREIPLPSGPLVGLFRLADRVKFGEHVVEDDYLAEAEALASSVFKALDEGPISIQNGR